MRSGRQLSASHTCAVPGEGWQAQEELPRGGQGLKDSRCQPAARPARRMVSACSNKVSHFGAGCSLKVTRGVGRGLQWAGHNGLARDEVAACVASVAVLVNP